MKHVIVIETVDSTTAAPTMDSEDRLKFQDEVIRACEAFTTLHAGECFIQSSFFQRSAIDAVLALYGTDRKHVTSETNELVLL